MIGEKMFDMGLWYTLLSSVTIPSSVSIIGEAYLNLSHVVFVWVSELSVLWNDSNYSLNLLGINAFRFCSSLTQVVLADGLTTFGVYMFYMGGGNSLLSSITIPSSLIIIGKYYHYH